MMPPRARFVDMVWLRPWERGLRAPMLIAPVRPRSMIAGRESVRTEESHAPATDPRLLVRVAFLSRHSRGSGWRGRRPARGPDGRAADVGLSFRAASRNGRAGGYRHGQRLCQILPESSHGRRDEGGADGRGATAVERDRIQANQDA